MVLFPVCAPWRGPPMAHAHREQQPVRNACRIPISAASACFFPATRFVARPPMDMPTECRSPAGNGDAHAYAICVLRAAMPRLSPQPHQANSSPSSQLITVLRATLESPYEFDVAARPRDIVFAIRGYCFATSRLMSAHKRSRVALRAVRCVILLEQRYHILCHAAAHVRAR